MPINSKLFVEVTDGLVRSTPPTIIELSQLPYWQSKHQSSSQNLFSSIKREWNLYHKLDRHGKKSTKK